MTFVERWIRLPRTTWLRKALFQIHLWSGIGFGLYVLLVSITGSILVFSNELYRAATPDPVVVARTGPQLTDAQLELAAMRAFPGYRVLRISRDPNPGHAVDVALSGSQGLRNRLFNPYTGADLGDSVPLGISMVSNLIKLHDDLLGGTTGRRINSVGGLLVVVMSITGLVVWWPGIATWRRGLTLHRNVGWQRFVWDLHSMIGFWALVFILVFGLSGAYLGDPQPVQDFADRIQPPTPQNAGVRAVDQIIYWLAFLHFGRVNGIGIPCRGPGVCDMATKSVWAFLGLAPAAMFITGATMWWNRVLRKRLPRKAQAGRG